FFGPTVLDPDHTGRNPEIVVLDEDEWPGRSEGRRWQRSDPVLHVELRKWADTFVVAPLDANTLAKFAHGLADNCLTCVWRAWDRQRPAVLAPAMNTVMWEQPVTLRHLRQLAADAGAEPPPGLDLHDVIGHGHERCPRLPLAPTQGKILACGDVGDGAMASGGDVAAC